MEGVGSRESERGWDSAGLGAIAVRWLTPPASSTENVGRGRKVLRHHRILTIPE